MVITESKHPQAKGKSMSGRWGRSVAWLEGSVRRVVGGRQGGTSRRLVAQGVWLGLDGKSTREPQKGFYTLQDQTGFLEGEGRLVF